MLIKAPKEEVAVLGALWQFTSVDYMGREREKKGGTKEPIKQAQEEN